MLTTTATMAPMAPSSESSDLRAQVEALLRIARRIKRERDAARKEAQEVVVVQVATELLLDIAWRVAEERDQSK